MTIHQSNIYDRIIDKIKKNRISTTEIADCLGKTGDIEGVSPLCSGAFVVGRVFFAYGYNERNWEIHEQITGIKPGDILVVEMHNCHKRAAFGELVSKFALLYKGASAIVVNGYMRDANRIIKENYPIWCKGVTPIGCLNRKNEHPINKDILLEFRKKYEDAIVVCDDGGVVVIGKENINEEFLEKLDFIELQEDIWGYCINTKKWSTYETVCLKKYFDTHLLPAEFKDDFESFLNAKEKTNEKDNR